MDRSEFTRRVSAMQDRLYRLTYGMLREPQDRMDAVQEAVVRAWTGLDRLRNEAFFETWLTRILINQCHTLQRSAKRTLPLEAAPEPSAPPEMDRPLHDAILALDERLRLPVILHYMEGYGTAECARILRVPEGTVKTRLRKARRELKDMLSGEGRAI